MKGGTAGFTAMALVAFAANSVLCRLALGPGAVDAASFTSLRLVSGAVFLLVLARGRARGSWSGAAVLLVYGVTFSFAYLSLSAGTGALILFGAVQATMILAGLRSGERPRPREWGGLIVALAGVVCLVFPGLEAPSPLGSALMAVAGIAWGVYSLIGRGAKNALQDTAGNFVRAAPFALVVSACTAGSFHISREGASLAVASGALASGVGYVLWYAALRGLTATRAATVQLSVPVIAALGGVLFIGETITPRLVIASALILGGVGAAVTAFR